MKAFELDMVGDATASAVEPLSVSSGFTRPPQAEEHAPNTVGSVFSPHLLVLTFEREDGPFRRLGLSTTLQVAKRLRESILAHSNGLSDRARELLSGHVRDGRPLETPHLAFLPLALVGDPRADGRLLGMALALPVDASSDDRREALRAVADVHHLALGRLGKWKVIAQSSPSPVPILSPELWTAHPHGATHWSTVTPVVFDRHPKTSGRDPRRHEVTAMIRRACTRIGLPRPREVIVTQVSAHFGAPPAFAFPRLRRKDGSERRHAHAILVFDEPVRGPVVIGAGRYRGYGFCRPLPSATETPRVRSKNVLEKGVLGTENTSGESSQPQIQVTAKSIGAVHPTIVE